MKEIQLTQGQAAIVDNDCFDEINHYKWFALRRGVKFHACRRIKTDKGDRNFYMHHAIIGRPPKGYDVDHIDRNGLNNRKANLRFVTRRQNMQNLDKSNATSRYPGVYWHKAKKKWATGYYIGDKRYHIGNFDTEQDAFDAYRKAICNLGERMLI